MQTFFDIFIAMNAGDFLFNDDLSNQTGQSFSKWPNLYIEW